MKSTAYRTPIVQPNDDLLELIFTTLPQLRERSVVCITSKIAALCQGDIVPIKTGTKEEKHLIVKQESEYYLPAQASKYNLILSIKDQVLAINAGVDESNVSGVYALLPKNPYRLASLVWQALRDHYKLRHVGVVITDSKSFPLKWGVIGTSIAHCGFVALNSYVGEPDLFGKKLEMTTVNVAESLAEIAVFEMGESSQQKPLVVIEAAPRVVFQEQIPTETEIAQLKISLSDDVYAPLLEAVTWRRGGA